MLQLWIKHFRLCAVALMVALAGCTSGQENFVGIVPHNSELPLQLHDSGVSLFVATSRQRSPDQHEFYSGERSELLSFSKIDVSIPPNHVAGQIEQPRFAKNSDPNKHFVLARPQLFKRPDAFQVRINDALAARPPADQNVLVFVHGYNTNFSAAVLRMSQFVKDTGFRGVPVLFTWASRGRTVDYVYDINSALHARFHLVTLAGLLSQTNAKSFGVVAHSMGNLVTLEAMSMSLRDNIDSASRLSHVVLAAPDVDLDIFGQHMSSLSPIKHKFFVLVSRDDRALDVSQRIAGGVSRAGSANPEDLARLGLNVIELSEVEDRSSINHTKFAESPEIVQLIGKGINDGNTLETLDQTPTEEAIGSIFKGFTQAAVGVGSILTLGN